MLAGGLRLLLLLVLVLRVVEDLADGRPRLGRDLDEVELGVGGDPLRFGGVDDADLLAVGADQPHLRNADAVVDPGLVPLRRAPIEPARDRH